MLNSNEKKVMLIMFNLNRLNVGVVSKVSDKLMIKLKISWEYSRGVESESES